MPAVAVFGGGQESGEEVTGKGANVQSRRSEVAAQKDDRNDGQTVNGQLSALSQNASLLSTTTLKCSHPDSLMSLSVFTSSRSAVLHCRK